MRNENLIKWNIGAILIVGLVLLGFSFIGNVTLEESVYFDWDNNWSLNSSFVRISLNEEVYDLDTIVVGDQVVVDLSLIEFISIGTGYVDLVVNETVVDSTTFVVEEVDETVEIPFNDTIELNETVEIPINESFVVNETIEIPINDTIEEINITLNETVVDLNLTFENITLFNETQFNLANETIELNITLNETIFNDSESLTQYNVVINQQVRNVKRVKLSSEGTLEVELPKEAENVSVREIIGNTQFEVSNSKLKADVGKGFVPIGDTDLVEKPVALSFFSFFKIFGFAIADVQENVTLFIDEVVEEVEVEYYTPGPIAVEEELINGKRVVVSSDFHYENILTFTTIKDVELSRVKLYWIVNGSNVPFAFDGYDTNEDGLVDYMEWITPHTSEEEFIIEILDGTNPPTHTTPLLNASSVNNLTVDNLTVYNQSIADGDGDSVKNIYNWYLNGTSITLFNLPFEGGSTSATSANGTTKDYALGNNGTPVYNGTSGPTWNRTGGYDGFGAYDFDGKGDYISIPNANYIGNLNSDFSIS
ncbi:MAG: hypothetical protein ABIJ18_02735, partial [archaeon]